MSGEQNSKHHMLLRPFDTAVLNMLSNVQLVQLKKPANKLSICLRKQSRGPFPVYSGKTKLGRCNSGDCEDGTGACRTFVKFSTVIARCWIWLLVAFIALLCS